MSKEDWVVREDGWVHKEELKRWPCEEIGPELWAAICKECPDMPQHEKDRIFWDVWDFQQWKKRHP